MSPTPDTQVITGLVIDICDSNLIHNDPRFGRDEGTRSKRFAETIKAQFDRIVGEVMGEADGQVVNPVGDGWCYKLYDPQKAVQAALVIQARLKSALTSTPVGLVEARIGLHCAPISTAATDYIHQAGNLAARVQSYAPRGGIAVTSAVHGLCQGRLVNISFRDLGFQDFKGEASRQQVFAVECSPDELDRLLAEWKLSVPFQPSPTEPGQQSFSPSHMTKGTSGGTVIYSNKTIVNQGTVGTQVNVFPIQQPKADRETVLHPYLTDLARRCADLQFPGLTPEQAKAIQLVEIYAELHVLDWKPGEEERERDARMSHPEAQRVPVVQAVGNPEVPRMVLLGPPGGGKSTFLRHLAFCLVCQRWQPTGSAVTEAERKAASSAKNYLERQWADPKQAPFRDLLPIWVELRKLVERLPTHPKAAEATAQWLVDEHLRQFDGKITDDCRDLIKQLIQNGQALFLLDGLDEITVTEHRVFIQSVLRDFKESTLRNNRVILTCRVRTWDGDWGIPGWGTVYLLTGFDATDREKFSERWFGHWKLLGLRNQADADGKKKELETFIRNSSANRNGKLEEMLRVPLLMTMMAWLQTRKIKLPGERAALYEEFIQTLLWELDATKNIKSLSKLVELAGVTQPQFFATLCEVAFRAQKETPKEGLANICSGDWVKAFAELKPSRPPTDAGGQRTSMSLNEARKWARDEIMETMQLRFGLVRDEGTDEYRFQHRSFQEYLAAAHLTLSPEGTAQAIRWKEEALGALPEGDVASLRESLWEVFRLAAGRLAHVEARATPRVRGADSAFPLVVAISQVLCRPISLPWHQIWLAGELIDELGLIQSTLNRPFQRQTMAAPWEDLAQRIANRLARLIRWGALSPKERAAVGMLLGRLGDPRPGIALRHGLEAFPDIPDILWCGAGGEVDGTGHDFQRMAFPPQRSFPMGEPMTRSKAERAFNSFDQFVCTRAQEPFLISKYPVTVAQFQVFLEAGGYGKIGGPKPNWWTDAGWAWRNREKIERPDDYSMEFQTANHPRVGVSWYEALAYARWLNRPEMRRAMGLPEGWRVALPTEAQWELVARWSSKAGGVDDRLYPWGNDEDLAERCNYGATGVGHTSAVGLFPKGQSTGGVMDLSGNVWEWCQTKWVSSPKNYNNPGNGIDSDDGDDSRVVRGGSWVNYDPGNLRSCFRGCYDPGFRYYCVGFRLVLMGKFR